MFCTYDAISCSIPYIRCTSNLLSISFVASILFIPADAPPLPFPTITIRLAVCAFLRPRKL